DSKMGNSETAGSKSIPKNFNICVHDKFYLKINSKRKLDLYLDQQRATNFTKNTHNSIISDDGKILYIHHQTSGDLYISIKPSEEYFYCETAIGAYYPTIY